MNSCCVALSDRRDTSLAGVEAIAVVVDIAEASGGVGVAEGRGEEGRGGGSATSAHVLRPERNIGILKNGPEKVPEEMATEKQSSACGSEPRRGEEVHGPESIRRRQKRKAERSGRRQAPTKCVGTNHNRQTQPQREVRRAAGSARHHHEGRGWKSKNRPREQCKKREQFVHRK